MPVFKTTFFLGSRLLATFQFESDATPHSLAYFCHTCGDVWGRIMVDGGHYWHVEHIPCCKHQRTGVPDWAGKVPGSFLLEDDSRKRMLSVLKWARAIEHLPVAVLDYELHRHIFYLENFPNDD